MRPDEVVIASQQLEVIFQTLLPPRVADRPPKKIRRTLPDRQIQSFNVGRVQFSGILGILPSLFSFARCSRSGFAFDFDDAVVFSLLDDLTVKTSNPEDAPDD